MARSFSQDQTVRGRWWQEWQWVESPSVSPPFRGNWSALSNMTHAVRGSQEKNKSFLFPKRLDNSKEDLSSMNPNKSGSME